MVYKFYLKNTERDVFSCPSVFKIAEFTQNSIHKEMSPHRNVIMNTSCHHWKFSFLTYKLKYKFSNLGGGGGGWVSHGFLMLSSNLIKSKISMLRVGEGGLVSWKFDVEFKFAKIAKFPC